MKQNSSQKYKLQEFLKKHFILPSDNLAEISAFIKKDEEVKKTIYDCLK